MPDLNVGDTVWYVPLWYAIAIRCKVTEVEDWARKQHPSGYLFYWVDEPVGHALCDDELFITKEEAIECFKEEHSNKEPITLGDYRERVAKFIVSTHGLPESEVADAINRLVHSYPAKGDGEWLSWNELQKAN